jgi:hypothetical protein
MNFKSAQLDHRFNIEAGRDDQGRWEQGKTLSPRWISNMYPGSPIDLASTHRFTARLELPYAGMDDWATIYINGSPAYTFRFNGLVTDDYAVCRFLYEGRYYVFEYRLLFRENS